MLDYRNQQDMNNCNIDINNFPDQFNDSFETMNDGYLSNDDVDMIIEGNNNPGISKGMQV